MSTKPKRSYITYELPLPVRVLSRGLVPGCSRLGADRMHQLICTNGPRKARSALQRRMHLSNNLNRHAFPSKKSLRREREALQLSFSPHLQRNLAGECWKGAARARKSIGSAIWGAALGKGRIAAGCPAPLSEPAWTD